MSKMKPSDLKALLAAERADALASVSSSKLSEERGNAMDYYMGDVSVDMPSATGRSSAVSSDVSDTIEGLMPSLMEIFAGGDEVVRFEPVSEEDVAAAEQETDYVNHVFMQKNPGFLVLYSFIKDALLSKNGIVKIFWDEEEREERETYYDQPDDVFAVIVANPDIEVVEHTEKDDPNYITQMPPASGQPMPMGIAPLPDPEAPKPKLHDVTVVKRETYGCARVVPVPPEE
ncbi:MAG: hypothetical protein Q7N50_03270, partial [Armatimonadota bacterium]|nr:hypothetical protein [Armatimonadota bacterium]